MHLSQLSLYFSKSVTYDALKLEHKREQPLQTKRPKQEEESKE